MVLVVGVSGLGGYRIFIYIEVKISMCLLVLGCMLLLKYRSVKEVEWYLREGVFESFFVSVDWNVEVFIVLFYMFVMEGGFFLL